ncbi:tetratricopeptide repeat protein [Bacteroides sp. OM08-11]|nr:MULTISPECIES: histidine kinase [Bacteroides]RGM48130.1 tetratricopeptide repeat protein [Bacteroides sp. OM08-11]
MCVNRKKAALLYVSLGIFLFIWSACTFSPKRGNVSEMQAFETFFRLNVDSIATAPRWMRTQAFQRMEEVRDTLVRHNYLAIVLKTYLATSELDSAQILIRQLKDYVKTQPFSPQLADLQSEYINMEGNIYGRRGYMDSAENCFRKAYELRLQGKKTGFIPDILMNLADANNRQGKLDVGAFWYRKALLLCDSLNLPPEKKYPIYYGLAQGYMTLRDYEQCDRYYNLAAASYDDMLPDEKHFYLNNRGNSYYYRGDYITAIKYFRKVLDLVEDYPDMLWALNLTYLNLSDCFLKLDETDSAAIYLDRCEPFFKELGVTTALYYIDTQNIELALKRHDFSKARRLLMKSGIPTDVDPDMLHIRNKNLELFFEETGNYKQAYKYLKENNRLDDSIRNERVRMHTADLTLRYQQDSTLMAHKVLFQKKENEVLVLRQTRFVILAVAIVALLVAVFIYLYNRKKRALILAKNRRIVSSLRLENIRNRLSPHFIFNVLNQEIVSRKENEQRELVALVKLMRRNLELAEQLCVTLAEELDFVKTYIDLERRSLGADFHLIIEIGEDVHSEQVLLPSMLIQIPVENAVKHALRDKEGERNLWISIHRRENGICIKVTDNGGGYRPGSRNRGTGTGMKVIMQTVQILNMKNKESIDVSIHNISLPGGEIGCEIVFLLPDKYNYEI